ncbi:MAG: hypothetical protein GWN79_23085, partial [Actinobacteria bacterium]|nr:hypothetical protein [Actinomycetota bacterium]NIU21765.1 hypothetical protein [Actinomycetota bacterium]NIV89847.1 hypothetical protein [Actinomycetota bacterium]NIW32005.1 hypothetical protein [Actinomycetota bacterium]
MTGLTQRLDWIDRSVVLGIVDRLRSDGVLTGDAQSIALADFKPVMTQAQERLHTAIVDA